MQLWQGRFSKAIDKKTNDFNSSISFDSRMFREAQKYDIITHCDGNRIMELSQLQDILITKKPGDTITLTIYRPATTMSNSQTFDITVKLLKDTGATD